MDSAAPCFALGCVLLMLNSVSSENQNEYFVCPVTAANGTELCALDAPSAMITNVSNARCALECMVGNQICVAFNYFQTLMTCQLFNYQPINFQYSIDCTNYQRQQNLAQIAPVVASYNCSYPFTYLGGLYYGCVQTVQDASGQCNRFACLNNGTLATCSKQGYAVNKMNTSFNVKHCELSIGGLTVDCLLPGITVVTESVTTQSVNNWITIQQSIQDSTNNWDLPWTSYRKSFGSTSGNFYWMGLNNMFAMTNAQTYRLRIELLDSTGRWYSIEYDSVILDPEQNTKFAIHLTQSSTGDIVDAFYNIHNGMQFSTRDSGSASSCATSHYGAWWYQSAGGMSSNPNCGAAFITGKPMSWPSQQSVYNMAITTSRMMIRAA